jgi:hypothetical protein
MIRIYPDLIYNVPAGRQAERRRSGGRSRILCFHKREATCSPAENKNARPDCERVIASTGRMGADAGTAFVGPTRVTKDRSRKSPLMSSLGSLRDWN